MRHSVDFFDRQFQHQAEIADFVLNPFEQRALPYLRGEVLDFGCGLGNLALAAARQGCRVTALDGSPAGIARVQAAANAEGLSLVARCADLAQEGPSGCYDAVAAIGILQFFAPPRAEELLVALQQSVRAGGCAIVNVLIEGTTFLDYFDPASYTLFAGDALDRAFSGWEIESSCHENFPAPDGLLKRFSTLIAHKPA